MTSALTSKKYLLIDNQTDYCAILSQFLKQLGAETVLRCNAEVRALELIRAEKPDFIICEYDLNGGSPDRLDGYQLLEQLRVQRLITLNTIFILLTSDPNLPRFLEDMVYSPDGYLIKPVNVVDVKRIVEFSLVDKIVFGKVYEAIAKQDMNKALLECNEAMRRYPKLSLKALKILAELYMTKQDYDKAQQIYERVIEVSPLSWALYGNAKIQYTKKNYEIAEKLFGEVIDTECFYIPAYEGMANCLVAQNDKEAAFRTVNRAVSMFPYRLSAQLMLAELAALLNQYAIASRAYYKAVEITERAKKEMPGPYLASARYFAENLEKLHELERPKVIQDIDKLLEILGQRFKKSQDVMFEMQMIEFIKLAINHGANSPPAEKILKGLYELYLNNEAQYTLMSKKRYVILLQKYKRYQTAQQLAQQIAESLSFEAKKLVGIAHLVMETPLSREAKALMESGDIIAGFATIRRAIKEYPTSIALNLSYIQYAIRYVEKQKMAEDEIKQCNQAFESINKDLMTPEQREVYKVLYKQFRTLALLK